MGKYEFDLVVSKTKAVLTGYTGLFQEVIIMKTVNIYQMEAVKKFALILPDEREDASELCRALKMYITYESSFWRFNCDLKKGLRGCMIDLCDRILAQY